ncbi:hypothetical protein ACH419_39200 [Streptomyces bobili]|uniref:hypothetical protein n=1 Tax=Streptomyces bobili TaxID=67280 RepID=UPI00378D8B9A
MAITQTAHGKVMQPPVWCNELETLSIPVDLPTTTGKRLIRVILPATLAGDVLDISFKVGLTNNAGYVIGAGAHIWYYPYLDPDGWAKRVQISDMLTGQNVDTNIVHHLPMAASFSWRVPADWDWGRMGLALVVDAHSTAWKPGDTLKVESGYAQLRVHRWTDPPAA